MPSSAYLPEWQQLIFERLGELYTEHAPEQRVDDLYTMQELIDRRREEQMPGLVGFAKWRVIRYQENHAYSASGYVDLMRTWSTHRSLDPRLFDAARSAIEMAGGEIVKPVRTTLCPGLRDETAVSDSRTNNVGKIAGADA